MRKIKFRAWDKTKQRFTIDHDMLAVTFNGNVIHASDIGTVSRNDLEPMQYTGLKDKSGVEIYEGDIVRGRFIEKDVPDVMWLTLSEQEKEQGFRLFTIDTIFEPYQTPMPDDIEVIGNIWENPELLKRSK